MKIFYQRTQAKREGERNEEKKKGREEKKEKEEKEVGQLGRREEIEMDEGRFGEVGKERWVCLLWGIRVGKEKWVCLVGEIKKENKKRKGRRRMKGREKSGLAGWERGERERNVKVGLAG